MFSYYFKRHDKNQELPFHCHMLRSCLHFARFNCKLASCCRFTCKRAAFVAPDKNLAAAFALSTQDLRHTTTSRGNIFVHSNGHHLPKMDDVTALGAESLAHIKHRLRERFPYMKQVALEAAAEKTLKTLQTAVEEKCVSYLLHSARHG